jgi:nucleoside-diphosphate kinase
MPDRELEKTLVLIKPDALKNSLTGYVLSQLSEFHTGLCFAGTKVVQVTRMLAEEHYQEHRGKPFYDSLVEYIQGKVHYPNRPYQQRVIAIVYQGIEAVAMVRDIAGPTNPHVARDQKPGCIRSLGTVVPIFNAQGQVISDRMDNLIHASANAEEAEREIKLWFRPRDIPPAMRAYPTHTSDEHFYYTDRQIFDTHVPGSVCLLAPGNVAWTSDFQALKLIAQGLPAPVSLETVAAKYLLNRTEEMR